ncbi:hypothetical protein GF345_03920 [Candidatus Woesearchaeota archaeon]|nr:hypothetical protein [Candidatus Woesearchaeota archaeon]
MSVVNFFSDLSNLMRGNYSIFPRFTLVRMVGKGRMDERVEKHVHEQFDKIKEAEEKGSITEVDEETTRLIKDLHKEEKLEEYEVEAEEKLEMRLVKDLENLIKSVKKSKSLKNDAEVRKKIKDILEIIADFTKKQFADLEVVKGGRTPARVSAIPYDIGESSNISIQKARDMRREIGKVRNLISDAADKCRDMDKAKDAEKARKELVKTLDNLEKELRKFIKYMDEHFLVTLRVFRFVLQEIQQEDKHVDEMQKAGLPEKNAKELHEEMHKILDEFMERVDEESQHAQRIINQEEREMAEI